MAQPNAPGQRDNGGQYNWRVDRDRLKLPRRFSRRHDPLPCRNADPITLAILRWGIGFILVLPAAFLLRAKFPSGSDWFAIAALGTCFFGLFFVFYNIAVGYTTAARASLAPSTLPVQTMIVGALLGIEPLTLRKSLGVAIAMLGVFAALAYGLSAAPEGAWRGEAIMTGAVLCMALYNVWSRRFIVRSSALGFLCVGMAQGRQC
jgi:drug/metabolite transporter (DMT)-like permease